MLGQQQVVEFVDSLVLLSHLGHCLLEHRVRDEILLDLRVGLESLVHAVALALIEVFGNLGSLVHVGFEACRLGELEDIGVERRHLWSDVVEQVRLLHVVALDADRDLVIELVLRQSKADDFLLIDHHLDVAMQCGEGVECCL